MSGFLDDREHAAENIFAHTEELRFLAHRRAVQALGAWAAECMELDVPAALAYSGRIVDAFIGGTRQDQILLTVQSDLERAGKPALSMTAAAHLAQATAQAIDELAGRALPRPFGRPVKAVHRTHPIDASLSWRD